MGGSDVREVGIVLLKKTREMTSWSVWDERGEPVGDHCICILIKKNTGRCRGERLDLCTLNINSISNFYVTRLSNLYISISMDKKIILWKYR